MEYIYKEFSKDIEHLKKVLELIDSLKLFSGTSNAPKIDIVDNIFLNSAENVHTKTREANIGLAFIPGTVVLYLGGRFEFFIKSIFEELSMSVAIKCKKFSFLPKEFKENLIIQTSEVIKQPAKYGHAENGRKTFITNLSNNLNELDILDINSKCLSITNENMRPTIIGELFNRIGAKEIWTKIGHQAKVQTFFETADSAKAQKDSSKFLNDFIDERNKVAHPSDSFSWPDIQRVLKYVDYFEMLSKVILEVCSVYETHLILSVPKEENVVG